MAELKFKLNYVWIKRSKNFNIQAKCTLPLKRKTRVVIRSSFQVCECVQKKIISHYLQFLPCLPCDFQQLLIVCKVPCRCPFSRIRNLPGPCLRISLPILDRDMPDSSNNPVVLKRWPLEHKKQNHWRTCQKNKCSSPTQTYWTRNSREEVHICVFSDATQVWKPVT